MIGRRAGRQAEDGLKAPATAGRLALHLILRHVWRVSATGRASVWQDCNRLERVAVGANGKAELAANVKSLRAGN